MKGKKVLALALAAAMTLGLGACAGKEKGIDNLYTWEVKSNEMEGFFILNTEKALDLNVLCNAYAGLVSVDSNGQMVPDVAKDWKTEDGGLTWTFNLRDTVKWVDVDGKVKADCTAHDWVTALEWILNYWKNGANNTSMPISTIEGAAEYFEYTQGLTEEEGKALKADGKFLEMVGIEAVDDYTLKYTCVDKVVYFPTLATSACMYPVSQALIDELGVDKMIGMTNEQMWYTGPYTITKYSNQNEKILTKNPEYWDKDCTLFETVTITMIDDTNVGYQLFETGEIDHIDLNESKFQTIYEDENHKYHDYLAEKLPRKYSYQIKMNYAKNNEDGTPDTNWNTAVANENFRKAWYYGLDLTDYWARTNPVYPAKCENLTYTMKGLVTFSDGTDYTSRVLEKVGLTKSDTESSRYDKEKATSYKEAAMKELSAKGVTFPVEVDYYIQAGSQTALDSANVLKQIFADCLGDMVTLNIKTYVTKLNNEVIVPRLQSFVINGWGADYGDIQNFLGQETYGEDTAYYSREYTHCNEITDSELIEVYKEFTRLVNVADAIKDDMDARYEAYAVAEAYMLEHVLTIPASYSISWQLTKVNDYSRPNALYGIQNYLYKNWETSAEAYTTEEYNELSKKGSK